MNMFRLAILFLLLGIFPANDLRADLVDFVNGVWDHSAAGGSSANTGWDSSFSTGSTTVNGITVTLQSLTFGSATPSNRNLEFSPIGASTGLFFGNDGTTDLNSGALTNYQEWRFTFSAPVENLDWAIFDIDSRSGGPSAWRDALAAETWTSTVGAIGDGVGVDWDLAGSELTTRSVFELDHISRNTELFGLDNVNTDDLEGRAGLSTNGSFSVFSLYVFNDLDSVGNHNVVTEGTFSFNASTAVPEPASFMFTACLIAGTLLRRKR